MGEDEWVTMGVRAQTEGEAPNPCPICHRRHQSWKTFINAHGEQLQREHDQTREDLRYIDNAEYAATGYGVRSNRKKGRFD